jgi:murein L,D-transpeptidase YcbB/YkuD
MRIRSILPLRRRSRAPAILLALGATVAGAPLRAQGDTAGVLIRARVERAGRLSAAGEDIHSPADVRQFYTAAAYRPAWSTPRGLTPLAAATVAAIDALAGDGLEPEDYHARPLHRLLDPRRRLSPDDRAELDLMLSDGFLAAAHDLLAGRVPPRAVHPAWSLHGRDADLPALLAQALQRGRVADALWGLRPATAQYAALREALARYRDAARQGGWPTLPSRTLRPGEDRVEIATLRARIAAEAPLPAVADTERYDSALVQAVEEFQRRSGITDDGVVGAATRQALNVPAARRVDQIRASLERERWLPASLGDRYVAVYIPAFELQAVEGGKVSVTSRVIGGKPGWHTPIFSARMTTVIFNPYWNIPPSILAREVLPRQRRDPSYFGREGIEAVRDGGSVRYRQVPGPRNPLGDVKFVFPNPFNVYLHDTSTPSLFERDERAFSHGCVRVQKPIELAVWALDRNQGWSEDAVQAAADRSGERGVTLAQPIPVYIFYRTAWVDDTGAVQFRKDLYELDKRLLDALGSRSPANARPQREKPAEEDAPGID